MSERKESELLSVWRKAVIKLLMAPAQRFLDESPKRRNSGDGTNALIKIIPLVIIALSLASVTNMASRAYSHHASNSSYAIGFGLAVMVPVIVFAALRLNNVAAKVFAWACAGLFAFASGSIQFQIYNAGQPITLDTLFSLGVNLEALAFGFGVPFAECVLAGLEGLLVWQVEAKEKATIVQSQADEQEKLRTEQLQFKAEQEEAERKERERQEWQAEQERKRQTWQAEQDRIAAEHAQKLELKRQQAVSKVSNAGVQKTPVTPVGQEEMDTNKGTMDDMLDIYRAEPDATQRSVAKRLKRSPQTVGNWLKELAEQKRVEVNGVVKVL